ncbi:MAG: phosphoribosyltransferase family protein, partial [Gallionella sp.]|nr:phosphoribosyltransferase family protein [Gallionella sp.]
MMTVQRAREIFAQAEVIHSADAVQAALHSVASQITDVLGESHPLLLSVMGGAVVFSGQLLPLLDFPLDFDYVHVSRYGDARQGGQMHWKVEPHESVRGRVVLLLDDILDEGHTLD